MRWTTREIGYLEEHAGEGAEAVAEALGRTVQSVKNQASRYGISLRKRWQCTRCGAITHKPLSAVTGWCSICTKEQRRERIAEEVWQIEEEARREERENRERQRLYSRKHHAKKKLKSLKR